MTPARYAPEAFEPAAPARARRRLPRVAASAAALAGFFALAVLLQWLAGAYHAEFCGHPDEPAHYVTGLMVHDYLKTWPPAPPVKFAQDFYLHYPKMALGHWPPFFYVIQAAWTLVFSVSRTSVLLLMALLTALLAASLARLVASRYGTAAGLASGILLLLLPTVQQFGAMVMTEIPVALLCLWATLRFARYMQGGRWQDSVWFAVFATLAIMTKGSGIALALVPPFAMLFAGRLDLVRRKATWLAAAMVGLVCGPWYAFTFSMQENGWVETEGKAFLLRSFPYNAHEMVRLVGPAVFAFALLGIVVEVVLPWLRQESNRGQTALSTRIRRLGQSRLSPACPGGANYEPAAFAALIAGVFVFQSLVPASLDIRHLTTAAPALIAFAVAGVAWLAPRLRLPRLSVPARATALAGVMGLVFAAQTFAVPPKTGRGLVALVTGLLSRPAFAHSVIMVASQWDGEGIIISEMAMREHRPGHVILRASKVLADARWNGTDYRLRFKTDAEVMHYLERVPVAILIMDSTPGFRDKPHFHQLERMLRDYAPRWKLLGRYPLDGRPRIPGEDVRVYQLAGANLSPAKLHLQLPRQFP